MSSYNDVRQHYRPKTIRYLLIAESPPPPPDVGGSRHFYRSDTIRVGDNLFVNTIKALYFEAADRTEAQLEPDKEAWLQRLQADGIYMIESLEASVPKPVKKSERQALIRQHLDRLIERVGELASPNTRVILIKSNVFEVAAEPLRAAGFNVLNTELVDYPGRFNQRDYREKLAALVDLAADKL